MIWWDIKWCHIGIQMQVFRDRLTIRLYSFSISKFQTAHEIINFFLYHKEGHKKMGANIEKKTASFCHISHVSQLVIPLWKWYHLRCIYTASEISVRASESKLGVDAIKTNDLMFHVCTDTSLCPRFLSRMSVSELVTTCSNILGHGRFISSEVVQCTCTKPSVHVVAIAGYQNGHGHGYGLGSKPQMWCKHNSVRGSNTDSETDARTV